MMAAREWVRLNKPTAESHPNASRHQETTEGRM
jgi:hypothetical protein